MHALMLLLAAFTIVLIFGWLVKRHWSTINGTAGGPDVMTYDQADLVARLERIEEQQADLIDKVSEQNGIGFAVSKDLAVVQRLLCEFKGALIAVERGQVGLRDIGNDAARERETMAQVLELICTDRRRALALAEAGDVCSTGGHIISRRH